MICAINVFLAYALYRSNRLAIFSLSLSLGSASIPLATMGNIMERAIHHANVLHLLEDMLWAKVTI